VQDLSIKLIGDIAFTGLLSLQPKKNYRRFSSVAKILNNTDLVFANLEAPIKVNNSENKYKSFTHYSLHIPTCYLLKLLNIGVVSLANNHIYDYTMPGLRETIKLLDKLKIYHSGAGWMQKHIDPVIIEKKGVKIAFLSYVDKSTNPKTENFPNLFINYFDPEKIQKDILKLKNKVDKIICSIHWGEDYSRYFSKRQQINAKKIIDSGADIIMGHHPHTLQGYEVYNDKYIFYSLGQLCFGDFICENNLRSLKRKTKTGIIVVFKDWHKPVFHYTREKKENYLELIHKDHGEQLKRYTKINEWSFQFKIINLLLIVKESVLDRFYEFFFGYYRTPLKTIFILNEWRKISYIIRDFKKKLS